MNKVKDLGKAVVLALGLTGLGASVSSCLPMVAAGAGAYAGTKMAQKDGKDDMEEIDRVNARICYQENSNEVCVCGGDLYRNNSAGYLLLKGHDPDRSCWTSICNECIYKNDSRVFSFSTHKGLKNSEW